MNSERQGAPGEDGKDAAEGGQRPGSGNVALLFLFRHARPSPSVKLPEDHYTREGGCRRE
jgi:hypothetical protein